jgi:protein-disulfide isomerase
LKTAHVLIIAAVSLMLALAAAYFLMSGAGRQTGVGPQAAVQDAAVFERAHAARLGPADARVHIVEFLDPACTTCAEFYPFVKQLLAANPGRVRLSIRHVAFHKGSDVVVRALEAAKAQGKYWQTLEALLASQSVWVPRHVVQVPLVWQQLEGLGLDLDRLKADMSSPAVERAMAADAEDAKALKVTQTPEYFVNGRGLPTFGYEPLRQLVNEALAREYR